MHMSFALVRIQLEFGLTGEACKVQKIAWQGPGCPLNQENLGKKREKKIPTEWFWAALGFTQCTDYHHLQDLNKAILRECLSTNFCNKKCAWANTTTIIKALSQHTHSKYLYKPAWLHWSLTWILICRNCKGFYLFPKLALGKLSHQWGSSWFWVKIRSHNNFESRQHLAINSSQYIHARNLHKPRMITRPLLLLALAKYLGTIMLM